MDNNQTPQTPECVNEERRAFLGTLAATVATCTTGLATKVLADELSDDTQLAGLETGASDDAQGSSIDDAQETLTIEDIEAQIVEIQEQIDELEADADNLTEEQWIELDELYQRLAELENQKQALGQQILAEENQKQEEQATTIENNEQDIIDGNAAIEEENAKQAINDEAISNLEEINSELGNDN